MTYDRFDVSDKCTEGPGYYPAIVDCNGPHACIGLYDGETFGIPNCDELFYRDEVLWVGAKVATSQMFPEEILFAHGISSPFNSADADADMEE